MRFSSGFAILTILFSVTCAYAIFVNPATDYCISLGYQAWTNHTDEGDFSYCIMPNGTMYPLWDFYIGKASIENNYCSLHGYGTKVINDSRCRYAPECAACVLDNGTEIEMAQLMNPGKFEVLKNESILEINVSVKPPEIEENTPELLFSSQVYLLILLAVAVIALFWLRRRRG
jgi:putative hemolysin